MDGWLGGWLAFLSGFQCGSSFNKKPTAMKNLDFLNGVIKCNRVHSYYYYSY